MEETLSGFVGRRSGPALCKASRYEHSAGRVDTHEPELHTKTDEVRNASILVAIGVNQEGYAGSIVEVKVELVVFLRR